MALDKELFRNNKFFMGNIPQWHCPFCNIGVLLRTNLIEKETRNSKDFQESEDYDGISAYFNFTMELTCSNPRCEDSTYCIGFVTMEIVKTSEISTFEEGESYFPEKQYHPKFFFPSLNIISFPSGCDTKIKKIIENSFANFYNDYSLCANKIRVSLEYLMNYLRVRKEVKTRTNAYRKYTLGERIQLFKNSPGKQEIGNLIDAIKWIGNDGSHDDSLQLDDILDAYGMLEHILNDVFNEDKKEIARKAKRIVKFKRPYSKIGKGK